MSWFEALILGIVQGLTEYLPVSSSGHLAIGSALFGIEGEENLAFTIVVHVATVFSTLVVLWKEIDWIFRGLFKFQMNAETKYVINILISMIPIGIVGVFFKDTVDLWIGFIGRWLYAAIDGGFAGIFVLCQTTPERVDLDERRFYYRSGSGLRRDAGFVSFRINDRYRFVIGK